MTYLFDDLCDRFFSPWSVLIVFEWTLAVTYHVFRLCSIPCVCIFTRIFLKEIGKVFLSVYPGSVVTPPKLTKRTDLPKRAVGGHFSDSSLTRFTYHRMCSLRNTYIYYWVSCRFCFKPFNVILFGTKKNGKIFIVDCFIIFSLCCFSCHRFPPLSLLI